jgi:hypothetical protein
VVVIFSRHVCWYGKPAFGMYIVHYACCRKKHQTALLDAGLSGNTAGFAAQGLRCEARGICNHPPPSLRLRGTLAPSPCGGLWCAPVASPTRGGAWLAAPDCQVLDVPLFRAYCLQLASLTILE